MSVSGGIISLPIRISDVKTAVGTSENNFAVICRVAAINKWAKYKPVKYAKRDSLSASERKSVNYGLINIPTWARLDYMCAFLCADNRQSQPSTQWPQCDRDAGRISDEYFAYQRPTGGSYYYRMPDFEHYDHNAAAPIGRVSGTTFDIQPAGSLRVRFQIGPETTYGLSLDDLTYPGSSSISIGDMYFGVIMQQVSGNLTAKTWVGCQKSDGSFVTMSQAKQLGYWVDFTSVVTSDWAGTWKIYPLISRHGFDITSQPSGEVGMFICPVADFSPSYTIAIKFAEIKIVTAEAYRMQSGTSRLVTVYLTLSNNDSTAHSYRVDVKLYNSSREEQTDFTGGTQIGTIAAGATEYVNMELDVRRIWAGLQNGFFSATTTITDAVTFKKQGVWAQDSIQENTI